MHALNYYTNRVVMLCGPLLSVVRMYYGRLRVCENVLF